MMVLPLFLLCVASALQHAYAAPAPTYNAAQVFATFHNLSPLAHVTNRSVTAASAAAAPAPPAFGEIETSKLYCANGSDCASMSTPAQVAQVRYAEIALVYFNGILSGRPDGIVLVCGRNYIDSAGNLHFVGFHDFAGDTAAQALGFDPGSFSANGYAPGNPTEATPRATSSMQVFSSTDTVNGTQGSANGYQITDNLADVALFGGGDITLSGRMDDVNTGTGQTTFSNGITSCSTRSGAPAIAPFPGGAPQEDSEAVSAETDGD
jgi:hypothetical protein